MFHFTPRKAGLKGKKYIFLMPEREIWEKARRDFVPRNREPHEERRRYDREEGDFHPG
jgi:hypothetical protein